jgi:two-component system nitrogen regulation response regulator NtrX
MSASYILVVDDEPDIRDLVKDILEDEGYAVTTAQNAAAAREARRAQRPDLISARYLDAGYRRHHPA